MVSLIHMPKDRSKKMIGTYGKIKDEAEERNYTSYVSNNKWSRNIV